MKCAHIRIDDQAKAVYKLPSLHWRCTLGVFRISNRRALSQAPRRPETPTPLRQLGLRQRWLPPFRRRRNGGGGSRPHRFSAEAHRLNCFHRMPYAEENATKVLSWLSSENGNNALIPLSICHNAVRRADRRHAEGRLLSFDRRSRSRGALDYSPGAYR
jgi:hypothetical protein